QLRLLEDDTDALTEVPRRPIGVAAEHTHLAGVALAVPLEDLDGRRLAGAVRPEQPEDLSLLDREIDPADRLEVPVGLAQAADLDCRHRRGRVDGTRRYSTAPWAPSASSSRMSSPMFRSRGTSSPSSPTHARSPR